MTIAIIIATLLAVALLIVCKALSMAQAENRRLREKLRNAEIALMDRDDKLGRMNDKAEDVTEWPEYLPR